MSCTRCGDTGRVAVDMPGGATWVVPCPCRKPQWKKWVEKHPDDAPAVMRALGLDASGREKKPDADPPPPEAPQAPVRDEKPEYKPHAAPQPAKPKEEQWSLVAPENSVEPSVPPAAEAKPSPPHPLVPTPKGKFAPTPLRVLTEKDEYVELGIRALSNAIDFVIEHKYSKMSTREIAEEAWKRAADEMRASPSILMMHDPILLDKVLVWVTFWEAIKPEVRGSFLRLMVASKKEAEVIIERRNSH